MELVSHRGGNLASTLPAAIAVADAVELDIRTFRGRLEVRHAKVLWPTARLWERWELLPRDTPRPSLDEILEAVDDIDPGAHLWLDLKGVTRSMTRRVLEAVGERRPITVSSRAWWILGPAVRAPGVRVLRSVGYRWQRWLARHLHRIARVDGIVIHSRLLTPESIARLKSAVPLVISWAVDELGHARDLEQAGIDGVIVDDIDLLATLRDHRT